jgi:hypothetical protein
MTTQGYPRKDPVDEARERAVLAQRAAEQRQIAQRWQEMRADSDRRFAELSARTEANRQARAAEEHAMHNALMQDVDEALVTAVHEAAQARQQAQQALDAARQALAQLEAQAGAPGGDVAHYRLRKPELVADVDWCEATLTRAKQALDAVRQVFYGALAEALQVRQVETQQALQAGAAEEQAKLNEAVRALGAAQQHARERIGQLEAEARRWAALTLEG